MRKTVAVGLLFANIGTASAFDVDDVKPDLELAVTACHGMSHEDTKISDADSKRGCLDAIRLLLELSKNGYCIDNREISWKKCQ